MRGRRRQCLPVLHHHPAGHLQNRRPQPADRDLAGRERRPHHLGGAHEILYDKNGQVTHLLAEQGKGDTDNTDVVDIDYCYRLDVAPGDDCSGDGPSTTKLQWQRNNLTHKTLHYTYKTNGKLNRVYDVVSGTDPVVYDYAYDGNGNRTQADHNSAVGCVPTSGW